MNHNRMEYFGTHNTQIMDPKTAISEETKMKYENMMEEDMENNIPMENYADVVLDDDNENPMVSGTTFQTTTTATTARSAEIARVEVAETLNSLPTPSPFSPSTTATESRKITRTEESMPVFDHHHYNLVHNIMRRECHSNPQNFVRQLASSEYDRRNLIDCMWKKLSSKNKKISNNTNKNTANNMENISTIPHFSPEDIKIDLIQVGQHPLVLLTMPPPRHHQCAYFVAIAPSFHEEGTLKARYFTLERNQEDKEDKEYSSSPYQNNHDGDDCSCLCEWTSDGFHLKRCLGISLKPDQWMFAMAVAKVLNEEGGGRRGSMMRRQRRERFSTSRLSPMDEEEGEE